MSAVWSFLIGAGIASLFWFAAYRGQDDLIKAKSRTAFLEGRDLAIDAAAMKAHDMGHPEIRDAINAMVDGSRLHERLEIRDRERSTA